ncbi:MAG: cation diffusion facilitator family transporter [Dehalococcoidales bacterium]|nr:cation diffusion facilitator family transporter [Dehalococcoidales bacterium]MDP6825110.1 cation diffusion facilitator family transporter [Dehalococcoidales bacterium]
MGPVCPLAAFTDRQNPEVGNGSCFLPEVGAAKLAVAAISLLILIKIVTSITTVSVSIRADTIHSALDLAAAVVAFIGIRISDKPADGWHPYGHGKAENISSVLVAGLIFFAAGAIIYEAIKRLISGATLELISVGVFVTAAAIAINGLLSWYVLRVSRVTDSIVLEASGRHMLTDVFSSCAVLAGLTIVHFTGLIILDSIVALLVASIIVKSACGIMRKSFGGLSDVKLPEVEEASSKPLSWNMSASWLNSANYTVPA